MAVWGKTRRLCVPSNMKTPMLWGWPLASAEDREGSHVTSSYAYKLSDNDNRVGSNWLNPSHPQQQVLQPQALTQASSETLKVSHLRAVTEGGLGPSGERPNGVNHSQSLLLTWHNTSP